MGNNIKTFRDLIVWQKAMELVTEIYNLTRNFPKDETYGLIAQLRRNAVSIPSNIAEGFGRSPTDDCIRLLRVAIASLFELQTQLEISLNLNYVDNKNYDKLYDISREIERMLSSLIRKLKSKKLK